MTSCTCPKPGESPNPRKAGHCVKCGLPLHPDWVSSDQTLKAFFDRLAESLPVVGPDFESFRAQCVQRERDGRTTFGFQYLDRDNVVEAYEEAADGCLYAYLDALAATRRGDDQDVGFALTAAAAFYRAYSALVELHHKRHGAP